MPGELAPLDRLTDDNRGPIVIISAYSWAFVTLIIAVIRFGLAIHQKLKFNLDDLAFSLATLLAIANSVCYHLSVNAGLGQHLAHLSLAHLDSYYKMMFIGQYLGIAAMACAKTCAVLLSDGIAPQDRRQFYAMLSIMGIWALFSILAVSFQCQLPYPWVFVPSKCSTHGNLQYPVIIGNLLTDALLAVWILPTIWKLRMDLGRRVVVMILFGARVIVSLVAIGELVSIAQHIHSTDQTWAQFGPSLWTQAVVHLSVICATLPRTNRFLASLQAGHVTTGLTEFELNTSRNSSHAPNSDEPPLKLTPSLDNKLSTSVSSRQRTKKRSIEDWKIYATMGSSQDDETSTSSLFNQGGVVLRHELTQQVEYVKKEPVVLRR
ncbi:hypothetical protein AOQ84DRAFT_422669 [Glonium stellatum]|uniref:Rhodopsin domain-containing protein n=1 Tax=Glonium stellatum TaxID=574774 RepID=A0A8E2EPK5_9PEZI|nr:hypothetical protein AOQ84DRAFT_422669 [Glonium stellatum]